MRYRKVYSGVVSLLFQTADRYVHWRGKEGQLKKLAPGQPAGTNCNGRRTKTSKYELYQ